MLPPFCQIRSLGYISKSASGSELFILFIDSIRGSGSDWTIIIYYYELIQSLAPSVLGSISVLASRASARPGLRVFDLLILPLLFCRRQPRSISRLIHQSIIYYTDNLLHSFCRASGVKVSRDYLLRPATTAQWSCNAGQFSKVKSVKQVGNEALKGYTA